MRLIILALLLCSCGSGARDCGFQTIKYGVEEVNEYGCLEYPGGY